MSGKSSSLDKHLLRIYPSYLDILNLPRNKEVKEKMVLTVPSWASIPWEPVCPWEFLLYCSGTELVLQPEPRNLP